MEPEDPPTGDDVREFQRLRPLIDVFELLSREIPSVHVKTFIWVLEHEGGIQRDLCIDLSMPSSTASRSVKALSDAEGEHGEGLGLIRLEDAGRDGRDRPIYLTEKGIAVARRLLELWNARE